MENLQVPVDTEVNVIAAPVEHGVSVYIRRKYTKGVVRVLWAYDTTVVNVDNFIKNLVNEPERSWHKRHYGGYVCLVATSSGYVRFIDCDGTQLRPFYQVE